MRTYLVSKYIGYSKAHKSAELRKGEADMDALTRDEARRQKAGGAAALYLAFAYLAAMPYFLLVVDYQGAGTAAEKVALVAGNYSSMYAMYIVTYVVFGFALTALALALYERLRANAPFAARFTAAIGLMWSFVLVASGLVFTYGMTAVTSLAKTDPVQAVTTWQALEPVAMGLGGAGGEILGGLWVLTVSWAAVRAGALPKILGWLGIVIGVMGIVSIVPALHDAAIAFGLLQIVWFVWLGVTMLMTRLSVDAVKRANADASAHSSSSAAARIEPRQAMDS